MEETQIEQIEFDIKREFLSEASELIEEIESALLILESDPHDDKNHALIFRLVHTIKGSSFAAGFDLLAHFAHSFESLLGHIRSGTIIANEAVIDVLLKSNDTIKIFVSKLKEDYSFHLDTSSVKNLIDKILDKHIPSASSEKEKKQLSGFQTFEPEKETKEEIDSAENSGFVKHSLSRKCSALIVDDDMDILDVLKIIAEDENMTCYTASNAISALEIFEAKDIDVIISDLRMPNMDGHSFISKIRNKNKDIPIMMISGHAERSDVVSFIKHGIYDFIEKPFSSDIILHSMRNGIRVKRMREGVLNLASLNFKTYMAMSRCAASLQILQELQGEEKEKFLAHQQKIVAMLDEIAEMTNMILDL